MEAAEFQHSQQPFTEEAHLTRIEKSISDPAEKTYENSRNIAKILLEYEKRDLETKVADNRKSAANCYRYYRRDVPQIKRFWEQNFRVNTKQYFASVN